MASGRATSPEARGQPRSVVCHPTSQGHLKDGRLVRPGQAAAPAALLGAAVAARSRYHSTVAGINSSSGVGRSPKARWIFDESSTNGSAN